MRTPYCRIIGFTCLLAIAVLADRQPTISTSSRAPDGFGINVLKIGGGEEILYEFINPGTNSETIFLPEEEAFSFRLNLFDPSGKPASRTKRGEVVGARFSELTETAQFVRNSGPFTMFQVSSNVIKTRRIRVEKAANARALPAPATLFEIKEPGTYKLRLEIQCYRSATNGAIRLLRLPPVEVPVIKQQHI